MSSLVSFKTIRNAKNGDEEAILDILTHYRFYIYALSTCRDCSRHSEKAGYVGRIFYI